MYKIALHKRDLFSYSACEISAIMPTMQRYTDYFMGKKITVMGLGLLGRGVGDTAFLAEHGADIIVTDLKTADDLADSVKELAAFPQIKFVLGEHREEDFIGRDLILVGPSVPLDSPYVAAAVADGARRTQSAALFAELSGIPIIGVTGTRGKSTTSQMIHHVLETVTGEEVILGGTVRGVSNLQLLKKVTEDSLAVFELDSWQLQGWGWAEISPHIAVFTNFMEDHMNYYKGDMDVYFADKANIFMFQEESGVFVTTPEVFERAKDFARGRNISLGQEIVLADASVIPEDFRLPVPGEHNRLNAALAYEALKATSLSPESILEALATFPGVQGRLEYIGDIQDIGIFNDNNSTTPAATLAGLRALGEDKNIILIMGGADKGIDPTELIEVIPTYCKQVMLLPGTGTDTFLKALATSGARKDLFVESHSIDAALENALAVAKRGDVVLFSPGFASFGMYKNEYDRGDKFIAAIKQHANTP